MSVIGERHDTAWAQWVGSDPYTVGIEEEAMLLEPVGWTLAHRTEGLLRTLPGELAAHVSAETHEAALELGTAPHAGVDGAGAQAAALRRSLSESAGRQGLALAASGTHPMAVWTETRVSSGARYQLVLRSMRDLARREPTFALHVHVGVGDAESAIVLMNRLRCHLPLLLALSASSPFWQGRDTGLCSTRTSIFQAFPRVGIPRAFSSYADYVRAVDGLLRCGAFPEPTFLWWDVRPQPRFGTVEIRIMDVQESGQRTAALAALVQTIAHLELEEGFACDELIDSPELLDENRFLAARDGMRARLLDPLAGRPVPAHTLLASLLDAGRDHAQQLGCADALEQVAEIAADPGYERQRRWAQAGGPARVPAELAAVFTR